MEYRNEGGNLVATEIKITAMGDNPSVADDAKLVGLVDDKPISTTHGVWTVGGVEFEFTEASQLAEEHGDIGKGAYVEIEFVVQNGVRTIVKMESKVPPGAGDDNFTGAIETMDDKGLTAAAVGADGAWVVSGRSFAVTPATQLNGALAPSTTVVVNSFTAADGSQVATRISAVPSTKRIFLPIVVR